MILAADIGGTNARFALFSPTGIKKREQKLKSADYPSLDAALRAFLGKKKLAGKDRITTASIGVAGPVVDNKCTATNLPWVVDGDEIARKFRIPRVCLLNDLVALSLGALGVPKKKLRVLQGGVPRKSGANLAVIAAGTGLGQAVLVWDNATDRFVPLGTEGGHVDFAPRNELEIDLLQFLRRRFGGRVSYERILSGPGLSNLYDFFREDQEITEDRAIDAKIRGADDRNAAITTMGLSGRSEAAQRAVELFASLYGAEAGNLALKSLATGGVFIAGHIAGTMIQLLSSGTFMRSFVDKGRFGAMLAKVPVAVVLDSDIGLAGSAYHALHVS